jgi:hypothetical protein
MIISLFLTTLLEMRQSCDFYLRSNCYDNVRILDNETGATTETATLQTTERSTTVVLEDNVVRTTAPIKTSMLTINFKS